MLENKELFDTVEDVKSDFNDYFCPDRRQKFKQFYYDWHIEAMIAPFAELTEYFTSNFETRIALFPNSPLHSNKMLQTTM